jgi:glucose-1-phosphate cytidylyltransferase
MKAVILAGGRGTRLVEETLLRPKPMVEIGGRPILWHIMSIYAAHDICEFVVCLGYKGYLVKEYFANYHLHRSDVTVDLADNSMEVHRVDAEPWRVTMIDTGEDTMTGGRIRRALPYVEDDASFCLTYGDGLADVDITELVRFHEQMGTHATVTAVRPPGRFGSLVVEGGRVAEFLEKPPGDGGWINGGFFVLSSAVREYITGDSSSWEGEPVQRLARDGQLACYEHHGFWQAMDTTRDRDYLEALWESGTPPWRK